MSDIIIRKHNEAFIVIDTQGDRGILQEIADAFTFEVPGAKFMPKYRAGVWDGKIRLCNAMTGHLYAGLARYVEDFANSRGYTLEYAYDNGARNFSLVEAQEFLNQQKFTLTPRDYQIEAFVDAVRYNRVLFLSPTASGKSFIIYMILRWYLKPTLIIVPTVSLVHQMYTDFESYGFKSEKYVHRIYSGQDKDGITYTFHLENGKRYTCPGNKNIKVINSNVEYKQAKDVTIKDEIDDKWLQTEIRK